MNPKSTWFWALVAAVLFAFIFFFERHQTHEADAPAKILSGLHINDLAAISVILGNQRAIHVQRTNNSWQMTQPVVYPAQNTNVENLLTALENLTSAPPLTAAELRKRANADAEFGFNSPQVTLILYRGDQATQVLLGSRTAPGDQVFLRVVGIEDIFIVDANLLSLIPRTPDDWRDRSFASLNGSTVNRITLANGGNLFELRRVATNESWRFMPTHPMSARADDVKVAELLRALTDLHVNQFIDEARPDLESLGLQPPELEITLGQDTNTLLNLQFGKSLTNDATQIFARRMDQNTIVTISGGSLVAGRSPFENLRDRHLLSAASIDSIEIHAEDNFTLQRQPDDSWRVEPQHFMADSNFMAQFITNFSNLQVRQFVNDVATGPDLLQYGLTSPARQFIVHTVGDSREATNGMTVQLDFGSTQEDRVFVRRADEESIIGAISLEDFKLLPSTSWKTRDRRIWNFSAADVTNIVIHQGGRERQIVRRGAHDWSLAPGSQGVINDLAIDELMPRFGSLTVAFWTAHGETNRTQFGFKEKGHRIAFELKGGEKYTVEFGSDAPSQFPYAAVTLENETWIFEFPWDLYQYVLMYFSVPIIVL